MSENNQERFPMGLHYGDGQYISSEQLVAQAALLRAVLGGQLDSASRNLDHEPISYPEALGLYEIAATIYCALAENVHRKSIESDEAKGRPSFI